MKIDWQMYEDGLLDPDQTRLADEILRTDESARKELEGLRSFRKMVRSAALSEPVPHSRLRQILRTVVGRGTAPLWRRAATFATIAAGAVALAFLASNLFDSGAGQIAAEERRSFDNEIEAQIWASGVSDMDLPTLQLTSLGQFEEVHCGDGWACFDYIVDGLLVHVYMKKDNISEGCSVVQKGDQTYFVKDDISFTEKGLTVSVMGATEDVRWKVVDYTNSTPDAIY